MASSSSSSIPKERNSIIQRYIPRLITSLTNFNPNEENYKLCLQFVWSNVKHHRYLSISRHEVKRDIEGICEKFKLNNFHEEEREFRKICECTLANELVINHYERDAIYSIFTLLMTLAYDPIGKLKEKKRKGSPVFKRMKNFEEKRVRESKNFIDSLLDDNFKFPSKKIDLDSQNESELSEWTEEEDDDEMYKLISGTSGSENDDENTSRVNTSQKPLYLLPPKIPDVYRKISLERRENDNWLDENIHSVWWNTKEVTVCEVISTHPAANFNSDWQHHLIKRSLGLIKPQPISLLSEYCLLREIFWMFLNAVNCKFFMLYNNVISIRSNVSLPSTTLHSLSNFLEDLVTSMNIMYELRRSIRYSANNFALSHTLENYYDTVRKFLDEICDFILEQENILREGVELYTIIRFKTDFRIHAKMLEMLWEIHKTSILDEKSNYSHISALHLLASLNNNICQASNKEKRNLSMTLLMACLKPFIRIFDLWWTEARLHDLKQEFVVEKLLDENSDNGELIVPRLFERNKEQTFFIGDSVSNGILKDPIIKIMLFYAIEASMTLGIVSKLDRIHEMRKINIQTKTLYEDFMERIFTDIKEYSFNYVGEIIDDNEQKENEGNKSEIITNDQRVIDEIKTSMIAEKDDLMLLVFSSTFENHKSTDNKSTGKRFYENSVDIYKSLNRATDSLFLPLENRIEKTIKELLAKKISIVEKFVMEIYINEYFLEQRFREIRQVFFLESNELMNYFCKKIFPQMENCGDATWANPYLMTIAFNEAICSDRTYTTIFNVNVNKKYDHISVLDAIDSVTIHFNVDSIFECIFTVDAKEKYNEVFRFLLKIKWSQRILNYLRYPEFFKRRKPFAKLQMLDLVMKRLALTRFCMQQALNTIHNHIMVNLQGISHQFDLNVSKSKKINEIIQSHKNFVDIFHRKSFLNKQSKRTRGIIIEMLKLSKVIRDEWYSITAFHTLDCAGKIDDSHSLAKFNLTTIEIEKAFMQCEIQLKNLLDN